MIEDAIWLSGWITWSVICYFWGAVVEYHKSNTDDNRMDIPLMIALLLISATVYITLSLVKLK
jgi:heme/copper-type cytochrome/quinol oxidase subunit 2